MNLIGLRLINFINYKNESRGLSKGVLLPGSPDRASIILILQQS